MSEKCACVFFVMHAINFCLFNVNFVCVCICALTLALANSA